jgi:AcrR family transcriptional regulator
MTRRKSKGPSAERYIEETLAMIVETGGSRNVNLRAISRRVGCAHTNVYNYFSSLEDLLWAAFRRALGIYAAAIVEGLDDSLSGHAYFRRLTGNLVGFAVDQPGLYRFVGSDPLDPARIPDDILETVGGLKGFYIQAIFCLCDGRLERDEAEEMANILLAYLDGEVFNLINGRVLPEEDIVGRVLDNAERLFTLLSASTCDGIELGRDASSPGQLRYPRWEVAP